MLSPEASRWVGGVLGPGTRIRAVQRLAGATSSAVFAIEAQHRGQSLGLVLRLFENAGWLREEPDLAVHEAAALQRAAQVGGRTPALIAFDETGTHCGVPAVLMTRLPGGPQLRPADLEGWLSRLAEAILPFHSVEADGFPWRYQRYNHVLALEPPTWSCVPELWARAIEIVSGPPPPTRRCFIHRDYHPMNVLWQAEEVSGIVDWMNGCVGPPNTDIAWCRGNLIHLYGIPAADRFLRHYQALAGPSFAYHPYWDLMVILEVLPGPPGLYPPWAVFGAGPADVQAMRQNWDEYLAHVLQQL